MKQNRIVVGVLFAVFLLVILACGGGGGNPGTTGTTSGTIVGPVTNVRLEAVIDGTSTVVDPTNVFVNEVVKLRLTGIDTGTVGQPRVVLPSTWSMTGTPGGNLSSNGTFVANSAPTGFFGSATSSYDGMSYTTSIRVVSPEAILTGRGRLINGSPTPNIQIQALNASGTVVATGLVGADGSIRMSAPTTAVKFTTAFPGTYYVKQFAYNGKDYATTIAGCTASLPALTLGVSTSLSTDIVFYSSYDTSPPPPPDGCGG